MEEEQYLNGTSNTLIRYYYYLEQGLNVLNQFRNLFLGIIGLYIAFKFTNPLWILLMGVVSVLGLTIVGYYTVHKVAKVKEWVSIRFSTHYAVQNFDYMKEIHAILKQMNDRHVNH